MGCFEGHPWIHLLPSKELIVQYARNHGIEGERGYSLELIVDYMTDPMNFNMTPATAYVEVCARLSSLRIVENSLAMEEKAMLEHPLGKEALARGYLADDLLAVTHSFIARKPT